jgi:hypothetical protein
MAGPTCEILLAADDRLVLDAIAAVLAKVAERIEAPASRTSVVGHGYGRCTADSFLVRTVASW